jgi:hypothetical protein
MVRGGSSIKGCNDMYEAMARAKAEPMRAPRQALRVAMRMKRFPKTFVERARHVKMTKGLKRYAAATAEDDQRFDSRDDVKKRVVYD